MSLVHKPEMTEKNLAALGAGFGARDWGLGLGACCQLSAVGRQLQKNGRFQLWPIVAAHERAFQKMEELEKTAALHDVPETEGVSCLASKCLNTLSHSNTKS